MAERGVKTVLVCASFTGEEGRQLHREQMEVQVVNRAEGANTVEAGDPSRRLILLVQTQQLCPAHLEQVHAADVLR
jgi:hypothetical protein